MDAVRPDRAAWFVGKHARTQQEVLDYRFKVQVEHTGSGSQLVAGGCKHSNAFDRHWPIRRIDVAAEGDGW